MSTEVFQTGAVLFILMVVCDQALALIERMRSAGDRPEAPETLRGRPAGEKGGEP